MGNYQYLCRHANIIPLFRRSFLAGDHSILLGKINTVSRKILQKIQRNERNVRLYYSRKKMN